MRSAARRLAGAGPIGRAGGGAPSGRFLGSVAIKGFPYALLDSLIELLARDMFLAHIWPNHGFWCERREMSAASLAGRRVLRTCLTVLSSLALAMIALAPASSAQASGTPGPKNPYSPAYQHAYRHGVVPTRETGAKMQQWQQQNRSAALAANDLNYGGGVDGIGVTTGHPKVYLVFWGSQWGSASTNGS